MRNRPTSSDPVARQSKSTAIKLLSSCLGATFLSCFATAFGVAQTAGTYNVTNIISDGSVPATATAGTVTQSTAVTLTVQ